MKTTRTDDPREAGRFLRLGKLVAFPTETVFGLGVDATSSRAVNRLFAAKGRPADNPLIVHLAQIELWPLAARQMPPAAADFLSAFAPGPLTVVLPKNEEICGSVTADLDTVGVRIPDCEITRELLSEAAVPVAAPSANLSGRPSCTQWESVLEDLDGRIDAILCHNPANIGLESTVVDCCQEPPLLLRPGAVSLEQLQRIVPGTSSISARAYDQQAGQTTTASPGLRHPHYQPSAKVLLFDSDPADLGLSAREYGKLTCCGMSTPINSDSFLHFRVYSSVSDYAGDFYEFLRQSDRLGASIIACQLSPPVGLGVALRDRQLRARPAWNEMPPRELKRPIEQQHHQLWQTAFAPPAFATYW